MGYLMGICFARFHSELRTTTDVMVAQASNTEKEQKEEKARSFTAESSLFLVLKCEGKRHNNGQKGFLIDREHSNRKG
jgi:hypothetical protein